MTTWTERCSIRIDPGRLRSILDDFANGLDEAGYTRLTVADDVRSGAHFGYWITQSGIALPEIDDDVLNDFGTHRCECPCVPRWEGRSQRYIARVRRFVDFLTHVGLVPPRSTPAVEEAPLLVEFRNWLSLHRGLSDGTIMRHVGLMRRLLHDMGDDPHAYTSSTIRKTVCAHASRHCRGQAMCIVTALRSYLKFLISHDVVSPELIGAVPTVPQWRLSSLPRYLPEAEVERVIASCDTSKPIGIRDRAILLLLSRLGLRAGDIVAMRVRDVDWTTGSLILAGKGRREVRLPLPQDVGDAMLFYLESVRPPLPIEQVFLGSNAPWRAFSGPAAVSGMGALLAPIGGVIGVRLAPLAYPPHILLRIAVNRPLLRVVPAPMAGQLAGMTTLRFRAVLLVMEVPRVGQIQLAAAVAFTLPPPLSRILGFHGDKYSMKPARLRDQKAAEEEGGRRCSM